MPPFVDASASVGLNNIDVNAYVRVKK